MSSQLHVHMPNRWTGVRNADTFRSWIQAQKSHSSADELREWLRAHVSRLMLEEISKNDRERDVAQYLAYLEDKLGICPSGGQPHPYPREVLELERWGEPDKQYINEPPSGGRGHLKRLLSCTLLLDDAAHLEGRPWSADEDFIENSATTVIQLARSAIALGEQATRLAMGYLIWVRNVQLHPTLSPFASFCVLLLAFDARFEDISDDNLAELCDWVEQEESRCRQSLGARAKSERWLTGLNIHFESRQDRDRLLNCGSLALSNPIIRYPKTRERLLQLLGRIAA